MTNAGKICSVALLALMAATAQAQSASSEHKAKAGQAKPKTQEQILLEQLTEKFQALDQLNQKYQGLEQQVQDLKGQLQQANSAAAAIRTRFRPNRSLVKAARLAPATHPRSRLLAAISVRESLHPNWLFRKTIAPLITAVSKPNNRPPIAATAAGKYT